MITEDLPQPSHTYFDSFKYESTNIIDLQLTTGSEVLKRIDEIKSSSATGPDKIPVKFLKNYKEQVSNALSSLINNSIIAEAYPDELKESMVTPVYKEGDKRDCGNYRPVSVPTAISKIYESFLNAWFVTVLTLNSIIHKNQFGFQKLSNTTSSSLRTWIEVSLWVCFS